MMPKRGWADEGKEQRKALMSSPQAKNTNVQQSSFTHLFSLILSMSAGQREHPNCLDCDNDMDTEGAKFGLPENSALLEGQ